MTTITPGAEAGAVKGKGVFTRFLHRPLGVASAIIIVVVILVAILAPLLAPYSPDLVNYTQGRATPSWAHPLGGDSSGRDILSRLIYGTRVTIYGALVATLIAMVLGVPAAIVAGYYRGWTDKICSWISDALQSVPAMIVLLIVAAGTNGNFIALMIAIGAFMSPGFYRITRARAYAVSGEAYIDAARVSGISDARILATHLLRSVQGPVLIQVSMTAGIAAGIQAGLQFLGIGSTTQASWGQMMNDGFQTMLNYPLILLWPSLAFGLTTAALVIIGSTFADLSSTQADRPWRRSQRAAAAAAAAAPSEASSVSGIAHDVEHSALRIENLRVCYPTGDGVREVVHGISLDAAPGEVVGIVGESGSGKSQTIFSAMDLLPRAARCTADGIWIDGHELTGQPRAKRKALLGKEIGFVPQEPMSNLDPSYKIGFQLTEPLRQVVGLSRSEARRRAVELLTRVGINDPERVLAAYPHEISGGMAQRVLIAGAVAANPTLLLADEPTTGLDVTVQAEVLELLRELARESSMALVIVTHNFGVVADICDRVIVMKDGDVVESGTVGEVFHNPADPYTAELISASLDDVELRSESDAAAVAHRKVAV